MAVGDSRTFSGTVAAVPSATEILLDRVQLVYPTDPTRHARSFRIRSLFFTIRQALLPTCKLAIESPSWESISVQLL